MRVGGESEIHLGAQQFRRAVKLDFVDGVPTVALPRRDGTSSTASFRGREAVAVHVFLRHPNNGGISNETLALLGISSDQGGGIVAAARRAGMTIVEDLPGVYAVRQSGSQENSPARGSRGISSGWRYVDGSSGLPFWSTPRRRNLTSEILGAPVSDGVRPIRRGS